jgi:hypothetical protein
MVATFDAVEVPFPNPMTGGTSHCTICRAPKWQQPLLATIACTPAEVVNGRRQHKMEL